MGEWGFGGMKVHGMWGMVVMGLGGVSADGERVGGAQGDERCG